MVQISSTVVRRTETDRQAGRAPQSEKAHLRKREILRAASRVFRQRGLHSTGMREIAAELGMHVGNLYYYFAGKDDLLAFCQQDALGALRAAAAEIRETDGGADEKLRLLIERHVVCLNEETPGSLAHLEVEALPAELREPIVAQRDSYEGEVRALIREGIESGALRDCDSGIAARTILGAANWTVKWYRPGGPKSAETIGRELAELLIEGLRPPQTNPVE